MASDDRELTVSPPSNTSSAWKTLSLMATMRTSTRLRPRALITSRSRSCVSGRGGTIPCCACAIAVASEAPTQIGR